MKIVIALTCACAGAFHPLSAAAQVGGWLDRVPASANSSDMRPFVTYPKTIRYQQVYSSSGVALGAQPFHDFTKEIYYLDGLVFRADGQNGGLTVGVQINASTTQKSVDNLSTIFSENIGPDEKVVFGPAVCTLAAPYFEINFTNSFRYNPGAGNLLLDFRVFDGGRYVTPDVFGPFYAALVSTDAVSRVWTEDVNAISATNSDTGGLYTGLVFDPPPTLSTYMGLDRYGSNILVLLWSGYPVGFSLQSSPDVGSDTGWLPVTNAGQYGYVIYYRTNGPKTFYRLASPAP